MGMFDEILIKKALPLPQELKNHPIKWSEHKFQTKDLDNCLEEFILDKNGSLYKIEVEREYIEYTEEEKKSKDFRAWNIHKDVVEKSRKKVKTNFHGIICFYDYLNFNEEKDCWLEFEAYFIYGKLDKIELKEFRLEDSYTLRLSELEKEKEANKKTAKYKLIQLIKITGVYQLLMFFAKICNRLSHFFTSLQWKIYKITSL